MFTSKRFQARAQREINKDSFIHEWPEKGLILFESPNDPAPQIKVNRGRVVELDGRPEAEFDLLDRFIAEYAIDASIAEECMAVDSLALARSLADFNVPRQDVLRLFSGLTPAKLTQVVNRLNVVEMMMAMQKMRARRTPSNQAHVTNRKEHPALLAADAAEAVERGFAELETTVGVARYAPFNALALLVGSQTGRGTALTQCAVEEALSLHLALLGLTTYAETLSVYGTEQAFRDGDDTPWSKAFLGSAYASRGIKVRFTSGTGSEALMGHSEGKSMLYLEARCLMAIKGAGSQGVQNGSISCIALPESLPGGVRGVMAENLIATLLDLELASGNDAMASHSQIRKSSKLMLQMLPGTDFIFSGYSSMPREDNLFGGGNFDAEDLDDYNVLQRDMQVDGGLRPVSEAEVLAVRRRAAQAIQTVFRVLDLPAISEAEVEAAVAARSSSDMPNRNVVADLEAAERFLRDGKSGVDVIRALAQHGFRDIAEKVLGLQKLRVSGDYLQTSAVVLPGPRVVSAINDPNDYGGPGTGYALNVQRWREITSIPQALQPQSIGQPSTGNPQMQMEEHGDAKPGLDPREIVIALGPAFGVAMDATLLGLPHHAVLRALMEGVQAEGLTARVVKVYSTSDCGFIGHAGAQLSGSGISIGIQSKGTTVIHRRDLEPLNNLELFPQAPNLTLDSYRVIGQNAAKYAKGEPVLPVPIQIDNMARLKYIVNTTLLHHRETEQVVKGRPAQEVLGFDSAWRRSENGRAVQPTAVAERLNGVERSVSTSKLKLFRLLGITFQIDLAWILVFALIAFSLAAQFSKEYPGWSVAHTWIVGIVTCVLFFVSIILHELSHCLVARAAGLPVQSITLFILGGVSHIGKEAQRPGIEFLVSAAGPLASVAVSASFAVLHLATRANLETVAAVAEWLAEINLVLVIFNLIPAFPLDGGRILRSALWGISNDFSKATRIASAVGRTTSVLFFLGGVLFVLAGQFTYGLWIGLIGWFLWAASRQNQRQADLRDSLAGLTASDLMVSNCLRVQTGTNLAKLEDGVDAGSLPRWVLVLNGTSLEGILAWEKVAEVARDLWGQTRIEALMTPLAALRWVRPHQGVVHILEAMDREGIPQVPVVDNGRLLGVLGRAEVYRFLHHRFSATG